ncbi:CaiB/BaiF CoA-transferase family protein [Phenylobacterium sp.]|uniref:CaiB/BaiF CoA transferase family protein n=1 Tax=Phenylobacterium sp. TaxID=1871053 RepID=UPI00301D5F54
MKGQGPLAGLKVVEFAGIGPAPMAAMLLADLGAEVITLDRLEPSGLGIPRPPKYDVYRRGRPSLALNLKHPDGLATALDLIAQADALIEGFRPGAMERIGLSPDACHARNPRLVYGRITGWGQTGPLAQAAGHDLNYIALTGVLAALGRAGEPPAVPLNLIGDYGGGAMLVAFGIACALVEAGRSGKGQVVDAAMAEGAATLFAPFYGLIAAGLHSLERGANLLDSGAPHYEVYETLDGKWVSVAPIEPRFREVLLERMGFAPAEFPDVRDPAQWPTGKASLKARFAERTRAEWCELLEGTDACFAPVLDAAEAPHHPHHVARQAFLDIGGVMQPAPAPRFSRTPAGKPGPADAPGASSAQILAGWGVPPARVAALAASGVIPA